MPRFARVTAIGLSLAIVLAVSAVGWRVVTYSPPESRAGIANPSVGHAFYAALNEVIGGGGTGQLDAIVTQDYADHGGATERSLAPVVEELNALGSSFPGTRFVVRDIQASESSLIVSLEPVRPSPVSFAGMKLTVAPFEGRFELLQVRNGKISARWAAQLTLPSFETFAVRALQVSVEAMMEIRLDRLTLPEGSSYQPAPNVEMLVMVVSGTARQQMRTPMRETVMRHEGEAFPLASVTTSSLDSEGANGVQLLALTRRAVSATELPAPKLRNGASSNLLWLEHLELDAGTWEVSAGRLKTPPGIEITLETESDRLLVVSSAGVIEVSARFDELQRLDVRFAITDIGHTAIAPGEHAVAISGSETLRLRAGLATTNVMWMVSIAS
jgi:hypothetical protein